MMGTVEVGFPLVMVAAVAATAMAPMVVVWTVSWPQLCGSVVRALRVTIPRPLPPPLPPPLHLFILFRSLAPLASSLARRVLLLSFFLPPSPLFLSFFFSLSSFSLSLFLSAPLGQALSPAFLRSFYRGLPRAEATLARRFANMARSANLRHVGEKRSAANKPRFTLLNSSYSPRSCGLISFGKFRSFEKDVPG